MVNDAIEMCLKSKQKGGWESISKASHGGEDTWQQKSFDAPAAFLKVNAAILTKSL
jgi:hypothetical protein